MTTLLTRGAEGMDRRGFSFDEIVAMQAAGILDPDEKFELIDGEIVPMSPQNAPHMRVKAMIVRAWAAACGPRLLIPEATLVLSLKPATIFEPDILVLEGMDVPSPIRPADAALVIEIADSTRTRDLQVKAPRYGQAGVRELWVVDLQDRLTVRHRRPSALGWDEVSPIPFTQPISPQFDASLALTLADIAP
jgi:Uma2 family endonuclease